MIKFNYSVAKKLIRLLILLLIILSGYYLQSCSNIDKSKKNISSNEKDIWGGVVKEDFVSLNYERLDGIDYYFDRYKVKSINDQYEIKKEIAGCWYDKMTAFLEKNIGKENIKDGLNYRDEINKVELKRFYNQCIIEIIEQKHHYEDKIFK